MNSNETHSNASAGLRSARGPLHPSSSVRGLPFSPAEDPSLPNPAPAVLAPATRRSCAAAALLSVLAGIACHDSSGGGGTTQDLDVVGLEADSPTGFLGHELRTTVYLEAAHATTDIGIAFLVADAAEVDAGVAEPVLTMVDARSIAEVQAGENAYSLPVDLPADTLPAGEYYLLAVIDPIGDTPETDEEDNSYTVEEIEQLGVRVTMSLAQPLPDLVFHDATLDQILVEIDVTPDVHTPLPGGIGEVQNGEIGVTATLRVSGKDPLDDVEIKAWLEIPGFSPSSLQQLLLWDTVSQTYIPSISLDSLEPDEHSVVHLDAVLMTNTRTQLLASVGTVRQVRVLVFVDPDGQIAEFESGIVSNEHDDGFDNGLWLPIALRISNETPRVGGPVGQLAWDVPFVKDFSNGNVGVGLRFGANATVGANGIHADAQASVPVTLAGSTFDLCNLDAVGLYNPLHTADNGMVLTLKALNVKLYEKRTKEDEALAPTPLSFQQEQSVSTTFMVGPVPMFVKLGARGTVGLDIAAHIGNTFALEARPFLDLDAFGEGGVGGSFLGWTLGGGLGASLKLVDEKFHAGITAGVTYDDVTSIMTGTINELVGNELEGPSGKVFLFVEASGKILWKTITERWEHTLARWNPFVKNDTLFNQTQTLSVVIE